MQTFTLHMDYYYRGASCCDVRVIEEAGWVVATNDYKEEMYRGGTVDFCKFLNALALNEYA